LVLWFGGPLVMSGRITLGGLVGFIFYLPLFYEPVTRLHRLNQMVQAARASSERLYEILDAGEERAAGPRLPALRQPVRGEVRFIDVEFEYETGRPALRDISLHAEPGQLVALVGPTGCGKTTLVNLLLALYRPKAGRIEIDGQDIAGVDLEPLRAAIGIVT